MNIKPDFLKDDITDFEIRILGKRIAKGSPEVKDKQNSCSDIDAPEVNDEEEQLRALREENQRLEEELHREQQLREEKLRVLHEEQLHSEEQIRVLHNKFNGFCCEDSSGGRISLKPGSRESDNKEPEQKPDKPRITWILLIILLVIIALLCTFIYNNHTDSSNKLVDTLNINRDNLSVESVKETASAGPAYVIESDTVINDIPLRLLTPVGGKMDLYVGKHPQKGVILAAHAADMRGDTYEPTGAFVYRGEIISKGHSKYGFCAIIDGEVTIGRQTETPLFERAIEQNGSFFRQYSLVSGGKMMIIPPKGKAIRRALCLKDGKFMIVETRLPESYLDLSQALADMKVTEALALCGSNAAVTWKDSEGTLHREGGVFPDKYQYENYIIWKAK